MTRRAPAATRRGGRRAVGAALVAGRLRSASRLCATWVAILALYVQIAAVAACAMPDAPNATPGAFPICHAEVSADAGSRHPAGGHAPLDHRACPFCALHCHALAAPPPVLAKAEPSSASWVVTPLRAFAPLPAAILAASASPRGPPARV